MLKFFRKYQKIFFIFIAFVIIVTFSFFGTQGVLERVNRPKDKDVTKAIDGSKIKLSEIQALSFFLATDFNDIMINRYSHLRPNLFNDGVLKDFLKTGLAKIFFEKYFDQLKPSFEKKFEKIQKYSLFVHFYDSSITTRLIYEQYAPEILKILNELKSQKEVNVKFLNLLSDLYIEQMRFPSETMRRLLIFQEKQKEAAPDPRLYQESIAFFGYENALDWFGIDFIDLVSEFIINTSIVAKQKGYEVTTQEAFVDLMANLNNALDDKAKKDISTYYKNLLHYLSIDEKQAANLWKKVMMFRRYFNDVANNTLIDNLAYTEFDKYTKSKANVKLYSLPESMHIKNFEDLIKFEMYLLATANKSNSLDVPNQMKDIQEIEKEYPQLIEKKYSMNVKQINIEKVALKIKVKDMYFWQIDDKNWNKLRSKFKSLPIAKTKDEKLKAIDLLEFSEKNKLDSFARNEMAKERADLIEETLNSTEAKKYDFYISLKNPTLPIKIKNADKLIALIDTQDHIKTYTEDNNNFFTIEVLQRPQKKDVISFEKAKTSKIIDQILNNYLQDQYHLLKDKYFEKFTDDEGNFKSFKTVRSQVAEMVFSDVVNELKTLHLADEKSLDDLSKYRFYLHMEHFMQNLLKDEKSQETLSQFNVKIESKQVARSKKPSWLESKAFSMEKNTFSSLSCIDGSIEFLYLDDTYIPDDGKDKISIAKNAISSETALILVRKLLKIFEENNCIVLPLRENNERT